MSPAGDATSCRGSATPAWTTRSGPTSSPTTSCSMRANSRPAARPGCLPRPVSCNRPGTACRRSCRSGGGRQRAIPPSRFAAAWQQAAGDAGWGGALAATAVRGANRLAVIVFRPGVDPLPLLAESLALLPAEDRWNVSFCTFFSKLPPGLECQWRCVLEGSPEAIANQRLPGALVIDLGKPPGPPPGGPLVEAARTGVVPLTPAPASRSPVVAGAYRASDAELARLLAGSAPGVLPASSAPGAVAGPTPAPTAAEPYEIGIYGIAPPPRSKNPMDLPQAMPWESRRKPKWPIIAGLAACAVVLALVVAAILLGPKWRPSTNVAKATFEHNDAEKGNLNSPAEAKYAVNGIDIRKKEQEEGSKPKKRQGSMNSKGRSSSPRQKPKRLRVGPRRMPARPTQQRRECKDLS